MAPKIFTLLRCPVTGTSGGQPIRLQVACRVESWRKLASSVEIRVDGPVHRWSVPPSSAPLLAIAWQLGRLRPVLLVCASGLTAYTSSGAGTRCAEPWHLLPGVCQMSLSYVLLIMRVCIAKRADR